MKSIANIAGVAVGAVVLCGIIYGGYWIAKTVSYNLFYKGMVIETIHKNVNAECLISE